MSPECFNNKPQNECSDIWSLGLILYKLTSFVHPIKNYEDNVEILNFHNYSKTKNRLQDLFKSSLKFK
jgi:serine/threonine protein kinase